MKNDRTFLEKLLDGTEVEWKPLDEVANIANNARKPVKSSLRVSGNIPYYGANNIQDYVEGYTHDGEFVLIAEDGSASLENYSIQWAVGKFWANNHVHVVNGKEGLNNRFLYHYLTSMNFIPFLAGKERAKLTKAKLQQIPIPIPPLSVQTEIVKILDALTALTSELTSELTLRQKQYEYYREKLLSEEELGKVGFEWKTLDQISENLDSKRKPITSGLRTSGKIPYYGASGIVDYVEDYIFDGDFLLISEDGANLLARNTPIAFSATGKIWVNNHAHILKFNSYEERRFIEFYLNKIDLTPYISGAAQPKLNKKNLNSIKIPIPSIPKQQRIVSILDKFETLTNSITEGLPLAIEQSQKRYEYYRELLLNFPGRE